ncbi:MAG TPA: cation:proton antiporter [Terracidiphilus sp.]|nr:cation:proton antiporter [Terracidiphilus sp.]
MPNLFTLILQIGVVLAVARTVGTVFRKIHQPRVVGEMIAGIMLGPSLLGWLAQRLSAALFPPASLGNLNSLSQVGLVLFMFLVGLEINPSELRGFGHAAVLMSHVSIAAPFTLAAALSLFLYPRLSDSSVRFTHFALFMGAAMSITAFPVLARILAERGLLRTRLGTLSIACAAVDDVTGWCILAYIIVLIRVAHSTTSVWITLAGSVAFVLVMAFGVKRLLTRLEAHYVAHAGFTENTIALIVLFVLASALTTEFLGIHLLFGSFLAGCIMPKNRALVHALQEKFESVTVVLLLPLFFAFTGLRTSIGLVKGAEMWAYCVAIVAVAIAGKLGGSMAAARAAGIPWRDSAALGILMNTRGLMELVILNIGMDLRIISPALFSMMVLMALVTTFMTTPLLHWVHPHLKAAATAQRESEAAAPV